MIECGYTGPVELEKPFLISSTHFYWCKGVVLYGFIQHTHLLIVLLVVMVLFGTNRLPEIGAGLGKAIRNFKQASSELDEVDATFKKDEKDITK